jgi:hypothetical protein
MSASELACQALQWWGHLHMGQRTTVRTSMSAAGIGAMTSIATGTIAFVIGGVTIATLVGIVADRNAGSGRLAAEATAVELFRL